MKVKYYYKNRAARHASRIRVAADGEHLYALLSFQGGEGAASDEIRLYAATALDAKPALVTFDRVSGKVSCAAGAGEIRFEAGEDAKTFECRVPLARLGLKKDTPFRLNFTRTVTGAKGKKTVSYWRGNTFSADTPLVFALMRPVPAPAP